MLDDDHIIDVGKSLAPTSKYDLLPNLIRRMRENSRIGVVGALYWQRGGDYLPVIMQESGNGGPPHFLHPMEVSGGMQRVDVTGGGCMLIRCKVFDRIEEPWFAPEHEFGTVIQLCRQVRKAGWEVWCDTSIEIGHLRSEREVITSARIGGKFVAAEAGTNTDHRLLQPQMCVVPKLENGEASRNADAA
jgi:hypothetical protein